MKTYMITNEMDPPRAQEMLAGLSDFVYCHCPTEEDIIRCCADADFLICMYETISRRVMESLPSLKLISITSVGYNLVDADCARERGIRVCNNPNYCVEEVADHATAMIFALSRRLDAFGRMIKGEKIWDYQRLEQPLHRLSSRTLGLVGFGRIARLIAARMRAMGVQVTAYDPYVTPQAGEALGVKMLGLDELLRQSHILSLHMPLTPETQGMFDREAFAKMEQKPIFINCARGGLVDEDALLEALNSGQIQSAGLDVLTSESPDLTDYPLVQHPNVILTPHAGFLSVEAFRDSDTLPVAHVAHYIKGEMDQVPFVI